MFEENAGQLDPRVRFVLRGRTYHAFIQSDSVVYSWFDREDPAPSAPQVRPRWTREATIRMTLEGADRNAIVEGERRPGPSVLGPEYADPAGLQTTEFERVRAASVYDGIDVEYYLRGGELEHDFIVAPGGDPGRIRLRFDGIDSLEIAPSGDLLLVSGEHRLVQQAPFVYQGELGYPEAIEASYRLEEDGSVVYEIGE